MHNKVNAIVLKTGDVYEARCGICGKLLFTMSENSQNNIDILKPNVIIVARCTRNSCKVDNQISIQDVFETT